MKLFSLSAALACLLGPAALDAIVPESLRPLLYLLEHKVILFAALIILLALALLAVALFHRKR